MYKRASNQMLQSYGFIYDSFDWLIWIKIDLKLFFPIYSTR